MCARRLFDVGGTVFILHQNESQKMYMKALIILVSERVSAWLWLDEGSKARLSVTHHTTTTMRTAWFRTTLATAPVFRHSRHNVR